MKIVTFFAKIRVWIGKIYSTKCFTFQVTFKAHYRECFTDIGTFYNFINTLTLKSLLTQFDQKVTLALLAPSHRNY